MRHTLTALIAALTLVVGFAVAQATGSQLLGGATLLAGAAWCVLREARHSAWWRIAVVGVVALVTFALSHRLADVVGAWPAVLIAAGATGVSGLLALHPQEQRTRPRP
ncbi:hypothetical protein GXB85_12865 [Cellulomonas sp. APG4]|uniref:hypothetical protein n=1 Tax=Cellulomonas sp. APG4 TaxID=1538656 RepID=UPI00137B2B55|nr:hypothetical protein [Cellulomonas sp. APG4]